MQKKLIPFQSPMTKTLKEKYIDLFCSNRTAGYSAEESYYKTRYDLQSLIVDLMINNPSEVGIIGVAYEEIKKCLNELTQLGAIRYDLRNCSEEIQSKYMPLTTV